MKSTPTKGHRALRKGRFTEVYRPYLLTTATKDRRPLFADVYVARSVILAMRYLHIMNKVESQAYVVMPDHIHWLCIPPQNATLSAIMHSLKSWTANELKSHHNIQGQIWQTAFHDRAVREGEDIRSVARYIISNPLRAGLANNIGDYPHWDAVWL